MDVLDQPTRDVDDDDLVVVVVIDIEAGPTFRITEVGGRPGALAALQPRAIAGRVVGPGVLSDRAVEELRATWETGLPRHYATDRVEGCFDVYVSPIHNAEGVERLLVHAVARASSMSRRIETGPLVIDLDERTVVLQGRSIELTRLELDLLIHLAERPRVVITREELLCAVWRSSTEWQAIATVTEHVRRVRIKLGDRRWIESIRGIGYRFAIPPN